MEGHNGFLPIVVQILASEELELGARQAGKFHFGRDGQDWRDLFCVWIAAIYFKNRLVKAWDRNKQPTTPISEEDRSVVKQSILQAMVTAPNAVKWVVVLYLKKKNSNDRPIVNYSSLYRVQLTSCLYIILSNDFPDQWSQFVNELENLLSSSDFRLVYVGLLALREVVKVYQ